MTHHNKISDNYDNQIAIIGLGFRLPGDNEIPEDFFQNLLNKKDGIVKCSNERWNNSYFKHINTSENGGYLDFKSWKNFDPSFFSLSIQECVSLDPQVRLLLKIVYECFENSSMTNNFRGSNISCFIGAHGLEYSHINKNEEGLTSYLPFLANTISYCFNLRGESVAVNTACSSSFTAIQMACESIVNGKCDISISGGINSWYTQDFLTRISSLGAISKTGRSHTFEEQADGYCRGEGAGVVLLKRLSSAIRDGDKIYSVIKSFSSNNDGCLNDKPNKTTPSSQAQYENILNALQKISMDPSEIYYIEPHGTGTPIGDVVEAKAIAMAFKDSHKETPLYIGSLKPNIGHLESASGVSSLIKCCLMIKNQTFLPMFNFKNPNPNIKFEEWNLKILTEALPFPKNKQVNIGINNFGIGGTNTFIILSEFNGEKNCSFQNEKNQNEKDKEYLIPFSANSLNSLKLYQKKLIESLDKIKEKVNFKDFVKFQSSKFSLFSRNVVLAKDWSDFKELNQLSINDSNQLSTCSVEYKAPIIFLFSGQGSQYQSMANELYNENQIFKDSINHCDEIFKSLYGYSIWEKKNSLINDEINEPMHAQPLVFLIHYGLIKLYEHWGVLPSAVIGHSFGDNTAAYLSGMVSLETICYIVYKRSITQNKTIGLGRMLSISIGKDEFIKKFSNLLFFEQIEIACYNSLNSIVIVSSESNLEVIKCQLNNQGISSIFLGSKCPFHSTKQNIVKKDIESINFELITNKPIIKYYSTVTSKEWDSSKDQFNSNYLFENISKPVFFNQTINNLLKDKELIPNSNLIIIEISPTPTLSNYLKDFNKEYNLTIINPLNKKAQDLKQFNESISKIYCNGGKVNYSSQFSNLDLKDQSFKWVSDYLPNYAWDDIECWSEDEQFLQKRIEGPTANSLGLKNLSNGNIVYQTIIDLRKESFCYLKDHKVLNEIYFPGVGYLNAIFKYYNNKDLSIEYLNCINPFILNETSTFTLQLVITKLTKTNDYFQFFKKENISNSLWVEVCNGKSSTIPFKNIERKLPIDELISKCNLTMISREEFYNTVLERLNITYGEHFQLFDKILMGDKIAITTINKLNKLSIFNDEIFSIPLLDSSFHSALILDIDHFSEKCLFERIEDLRFFNNVVQSISRDQKIYFISKLLKTVDSSNYFKLESCLLDGTLLFDCIGVVKFQKYQNKITIKNPKNEIFSTQYQLKDSPLLDPFEYQMDQIVKPTFKGYENPIPLYNYASFQYIKSMKKHGVNISLNEIFNLSIDELLEKYHENKQSVPNKRLFIKVFTIIKEYKELLVDEILNDQDFNILYYLEKFYDIKDVFNKFPVDGIDLQICELFKSKLNNEESELLKIDKFKLVTDNEISKYLYKTSIQELHNEFCKLIRKMLEPLLYQRITFKIIEFGGGTCGMAYYVVGEIHRILEEHPLHLIDIHYSFSDISPSFLPDAKKLLDQFNNVKVIYNVYDLDKSLINQGINQSCYDMVLMQFVLHAVKNVEFSINEIFDILNPSGHVMLYEPSKNDILGDIFFSNFEQWNHFTDSIRTNHCCLNVDEWFNLFNSIGFNKNMSCSKNINDKTPLSFIMDIQKPSINQLSALNKNINKYNNVYLYYSKNQKINSNIYQYFKENSNSISIIYDLNEIENINSNNNLIIYLKSLDEQLNENNFENYNINLTNCLKWIMINNLYENFKLLLITLNSQMESKNYLQSSLFGIVKYFFIHPELKCYSIDLDDLSLDNFSTFNYINYMISNFFIEKFFIIRNINQIYIEKVHIENNKRIKTESFEKENLICKLNKNLKIELLSRPYQLPDNKVEIKVKSTGINFQDLLFINGQVFNTLGLEFSGIVTRIGKNVINVKPGDRVYGFADDCLSSYTIAKDINCFIKPENLSFEQAATIPVVFVSSYYSLFKVKKIKNGDAVLIHSASGGVGLSCLILLKSIQFRGIIFCTVGSEEKKQFLINHFGLEFLNGGIFSTRDNEYVYEIKKYFNQNNILKDGCDLIINTLSGDFMNHNLSILGKNGAISDLSVTHILKNELLDFKSFGMNRTYAQIELYHNEIEANKIMIKLNKLFNENKIELIPFKSYSFQNIDQLFDEMGKRKHIGKLVSNISQDDEQLFEKEIQQNYFNLNILKDNYNIKEKEYLGSTVLITGQRGLALHTIKWITNYSKNVKDVIIFSRSSIHWELELFINKNKNKNKIKYHYKQLDIGNLNQIKNSINQIYSNNYLIEPIGSIFHYAFCLSDSPTKKVSIDNFIEAHNAKSHGAINLHNLSIELNWPIKTFILNSSMANLIGSEFQTAYISSNALVESLVRYRKSLNLPALLIKWGGIENSYITRKNEKIITNFNEIKTLSVQKVLGALDLSLQSQNIFTELIFTNKLNMKKINNLYLNHFDQIFDSKFNNVNSIDKLSIKDNIVLKISNLLQIDKEKLNLNIKLLDYGADSLLMVQFKNWIEIEYIPISLEKLQNTSINDIISFISN